MITNLKGRKNSETSSVGSDLEIKMDFRSSVAKPVVSLSSKNNKNDKMIPYNQNILNRRKSSVEKSNELTAMRMEAVNQLESTIQMADIIEIKDKKIEALQLEIKSFKENLRRSNQNLIETKSMNKELLNKMQNMVHENSRQKIEIENVRTQKFANDTLELPKTPDTNYSLYLRDIYENRERLTLENNQLTQTITDLRKQLVSLQLYVSRLEETQNNGFADYKYIEETTNEERSKSDLLAIIRHHMDEKMIWMEYAINLTKEVVARFPELLDINCGSQMKEQVDYPCSPNFCRWYQFSINILQKVFRSSPQLLKDILKYADLEQRKYIESKLK